MPEAAQPIRHRSLVGKDDHVDILKDNVKAAGSSASGCHWGFSNTVVNYCYETIIDLVKIWCRNIGLIMN